MSRTSGPITSAGIVFLLVATGAARGGEGGRETVAPAADNRPQLVAQLGHNSLVYSVAFSPDGRFVLTGGMDSTARLWDAASGKELRHFAGHTGMVFSVAFSPDGRSVLTAGWDKTARLWDAATGKELRRFVGHTVVLTSAAFSPDGRSVLTGSYDKTARLWDAASGKELRRFAGHTATVRSVAFSPDGRSVLTGSHDNTARLWDAISGKELLRFEGHTSNVISVAFSPDGRSVLTGSEGDTARLWDAASGKELRRFAGRYLTSVAFSPDGRSVLTGSRDKTARLWDAASGKELRRFTGHADVVTSVAFSPDGRSVLTGSNDKTARMWDAASGKELRRFEGHSDPVSSVVFTPDGRSVLTGSWDKTARMWDAASGKELRRFAGHTGMVFSVAFSPDGRSVLTGSWDKTARMWDAGSGKELRRFEGHTDKVLSIAFSPDGRSVLTGSSDKTARLWDAASGKELCRFEGHTSGVSSVAFSPDGRSVLTGSGDKTARLWDATNGNELRRLVDQTSAVSSVAFSPGGRFVLTGSYDKTARLWDAASGKELCRFEGHTSPVTSVAFSPDGRSVLTGSGDKTARLWDATNGKELRRFTGHTYIVHSVAFSPDSRFVLTGGDDSTARLWDAASGKENCALISFRDGSWAVTDRQGRFDASNGGDVQGLHWVIGNEAISLDQLKERYYEPSLLAKHLGFNKEALRQVEDFAAPKLFPAIKLAAPTPDDPRLKVTLTNRGGGIGRVVVKINGKELTADARPRGSNLDAKTLLIEVPLSDDPRLKPGVENTIEVQAFNAEGYLRSRGMIVTYVHRGRPTEAPPEVWAVVVGVSKFRNPALELRYAAKDAEDFAKSLEIAAVRLVGKDHLHLTLLTSSQADADKQPTRANLVRALEAVHKAKPADILVLYLAGHGVNFGGQDGDFYYLTADARGADLTDPEPRKKTALSSRDLTEFIKIVPAQKQVLVLDTCAAARAVERLTDKRDVPSSQVRALERVKDCTGLFILAGCAADAVSYEATRYAQGLLTYSLLLGMRGGALKEDQQVDVGRLFDFAADRVPELARDIGGIQRPVIARPKGASFPIGLVTAEDRARIPLRTPRPLVLRTLFQDEEDFTDGLGLGRLIDERLRDRSARGSDGRLVFVDARELPGAYNLAGRYHIEGAKVRATVRLARGKEKGIRFVVEGDKGRAEELAGRIVAEVEKRLGMNDAER